jgi:transcriptional regulator with XRE-family HTH domain
MAQPETALDRRDATAIGIGAEVRAARTARGLSTRQLAQLIGTSQPFVSNIENGRIFPSLRTLALLAEALEVSPSRLLPASERVERLPAAAGMRARRPNEAPVRRLVGAPDRELAAFRVELAAGESEDRPRLHGGEDFVTVLEGELDVLREGQPATRLRAGDALWLDGSIPHRLAAPLEAAAIALVVAADSRAMTAHAS